MQPYQEASQEIRRQGELPGKALKTVGSLAATTAAAYAGGPLLGRVMPFLSKYIPEDLAIKGLSKIDPRFGKFIKKALESGKSFDEVKNFIGEKAEEGAQKESAKESRNIIEQESPELHQFIDQEIKNGQTGLQAGAKAYATGKFGKVIDKLVKSHKLPWGAILENIYGSDQKGKTQNSIGKTYNYRDQQDQSKAALQPEQQQQQQGQGLDPALAELVQQGRELLNKARGNRG